MIKNWNQFIKEGEDMSKYHDEYPPDEYSYTKDKYLVVVVLTGNEKDADLLDSQVNDFHELHCDITRKTPPIAMYYTVGWWTEHKGKTIPWMRGVIEKEAKNLGIPVKVFTYDMSEVDFHIGNDLPERYKNIGLKKLKSLNSK